MIMPYQRPKRLFLLWLIPLSLRAQRSNLVVRVLLSGDRFAALAMTEGTLQRLRGSEHKARPQRVNAAQFVKTVLA
jgi:hypothetical protein